VVLYIHSPVLLHAVVLNYLSTGTTLPYMLYPVSGPFSVQPHTARTGGSARIDVQYLGCVVIDKPLATI
jgi:hypothetical protein